MWNNSHVKILAKKDAVVMSKYLGNGISCLNVNRIIFEYK